MKKIIYILALLFTAVSLSRCGKYLDVDPYFKDMVNVDSVFTNKNYTEQWLNDVYAYFGWYGGIEIAFADVTGFNLASDDAMFSNAGSLCENYQNAQFSQTNELNDGRWGTLYQGIRQASILIHNIDKCLELDGNTREDYRGQARFLRAYFYWMLIKQYGPVVLLPEEGVDVSLDYKDLQYPRATYDSCVNYIVSELEMAARILPKDRPSSYYGKATRGAALATRAKVLLYAASPLYNGNTEMSGLRDKQTNVPLISQVEDNKKWARAAAAAKEVIDMNYYRLYTEPADETTLPLGVGVPTEDFPNGAGNIDPYLSYRNCFNGEVPGSQNLELVFARTASTVDGCINELVRNMIPRTLLGRNTISATQKQVDAYYMKDGADQKDKTGHYYRDGKGFTTDNLQSRPLPAGVSLYYSDLEPRFYASIAYSGRVWECLTATEDANRNLSVFFYKDSENGQDLMNRELYHWTGIGVCKYVHPDDALTVGGSLKHKIEPTIRYADVLLWYAEALNEIEDGATYSFPSYNNQGVITVSRNTSQMSEAFRQVRFRAGLPDLSQQVYNDRNSFRRALKRERQIELFLESARYFDLRRWKDAGGSENEEGKPLMGLDVSKTSVEEGENGNQRQAFYDNKKAIPMKKVFMQKMYLWPIPQSEMDKNKNLVQNPGW